MLCLESTAGVFDLGFPRETFFLLCCAILMSYGEMFLSGLSVSFRFIYLCEIIMFGFRPEGVSIHNVFGI